MGKTTFFFKVAENKGVALHFCKGPHYLIEQKAIRVSYQPLHANMSCNFGKLHTWVRG